MKYLKFYYFFILITSVFFIYSFLISAPQKLSNHLAELRLQVSFEFATASESVNEISKNLDFQNYIDTKNLSAKDKFQTELVNILKSQPNYDQVRYLNSEGKEVIRIQQNVQTNIPDITNSLQSKINRYYFLDTMALSPGEMYVSPLDLNVENGAIEEPIKPTIRISTPVFKSDGQKAGIIIINYLAKDIIDRFYENQKQLSNKTLLFVNSDGYYFKGHKPEEEWGFMYADRSDEKISKNYPLAWQKIITKKSGLIQTPEGVFIFDKLYPIADVQDLQQKANREFSYFSKYLSVKDFHMVIILHQTKQALLSQLYPYLAGVLFLLVVPFIAQKLFHILKTQNSSKKLK